MRVSLEGPLVRTGYRQRLTTRSGEPSKKFGAPREVTNAHDEGGVFALCEGKYILADGGYVHRERWTYDSKSHCAAKKEREAPPHDFAWDLAFYRPRFPDACDGRRKRGGGA